MPYTCMLMLVDITTLVTLVVMCVLYWRVISAHNNTYIHKHVILFTTLHKHN